MARAALAALGALLVALAVANPSQQESRAEVNRGGRVKIGPLTEGSQLTQTFDSGEDNWAAVSVRLESLSQAEKMMLTLTLEQDGQILAQEDFSLAGLKRSSLMELELPSLPAGTYTLRATASGAGSATLNGRAADVPAQLDGAPLEGGVYLRLTYRWQETSAQAVYIGLTLLLLSLTPPWRRREARA